MRASALDTLIAGADVLVQNLAPGAAARLGLTHEALKPANPKLVVCDISGYGESGPFVQKKAYDLLIQAESGLISVTGSADEPSRVGISIADIATGMYAMTGILSALLRRSRTGEGANVKVAMLDALGRVDDLSDAAPRLCRFAAASGPDQPSGDRALWSAPDQGRAGDPWPAERAGMGDLLPEGAGPAGRAD